MGKGNKLKKKTSNSVGDLVLKDLPQQLIKLERLRAFLKKESERTNLYKNADAIYHEIEDIISPFNVLLKQAVKIDPRNKENISRLFELIVSYPQIIHIFEHYIVEQNPEQGKRLYIAVINMFVRTLVIMRLIEKAPVANHPDQHISFNMLTHAMILFLTMSYGYSSDKQGVIFNNQLLEEVSNRIKKENEPSRSVLKSAYQAHKALLEISKEDFDIQVVNQLMQLSERSFKNASKQIKQCPAPDPQMMYILQLIPGYYLSIAAVLSDKNLFDEAIVWIQDAIAMTKFAAENKRNVNSASQSEINSNIARPNDQLKHTIERSYKYKLSLVLKQLLKCQTPFNMLQGGEYVRIGFEKESFDEFMKILTKLKYKFDTFIDNPEYIQKNSTLGKYVIEFNLSRYSTSALELIMKTFKQRSDNKVENPKKLALLDQLRSASIENTIADNDGSVSVFINLTAFNCEILKSILLSHQCFYDVSQSTKENPMAEDINHTILLDLDDVSLSTFEAIINEFLIAIQNPNAKSVDTLEAPMEKNETERIETAEEPGQASSSDQKIETISESSTANIQQALVQKQKPLSAEKLAQLARHQAKVVEKARERERQALQQQAIAANHNPTIRREVRWEDPKFANVTNKNINVEYMEIHRRKKTFLLFAPGIFDDGHLEDRARNVASIGKYLTSKLSKGRQGIVKYGNSKTQAKDVKRQVGYDWKIKLQGLDERPLGYTASVGYVYENGVKKENEKVELIYVDKVIKRGHK